MKFEAALFAKFAKRLETRAVGSGVQLGGHYNQRFFAEGIAERAEFPGDNFEGMNGIVVAGVDQMNEQASALDVAQEADAQAGAFVRAFNESRQISDHKRAAEFGSM